MSDFFRNLAADFCKNIKIRYKEDAETLNRE